MIARMMDQLCFTRVQSEIISFADALSKLIIYFERDPSFYIFVSPALILCLISVCALALSSFASHFIYIGYFEWRENVEIKWQVANVSLLEMKFFTSDFSRYPCVEQRMREITPVVRVVWWLVRFLGHNQFPVSTQHHVRARVCVCVSRYMYVARNRAFLCRSCVPATRVSRGFPSVFLVYFVLRDYSVCQVH